MPYVYKATKDGTLSNPYRHVVKGETIVLEKPLKASWLEPVERKAPATTATTSPSEGAPPAPTDALGRPVSVGQVPKAEGAKTLKKVEDDKYDANTKAIQRIERFKDARDGAPLVAALTDEEKAIMKQLEDEEAAKKKEGEAKGTGNQDVL